MSRETDRAAIVELTNLQGWWIDKTDYAAAPQIFTADAVIDAPGGAANGIDELIALSERVHASYPVTHHVITNVTVDFDPAGDRAKVAAKGLVVLVDDGGAAKIMTPRYGYDAVRTTDGWRFERLAVTPRGPFALAA